MNKELTLDEKINIRYFLNIAYSDVPLWAIKKRISRNFKSTAIIKRLENYYKR